MLPPGVEPRSTVPKTATLSIKLRERIVVSYLVFHFCQGVQEKPWKYRVYMVVDNIVDMCIKDMALTICKTHKKTAFSDFILYIKPFFVHVAR